MGLSQSVNMCHGPRAEAGAPVKSDDGDRFRHPVVFEQLSRLSQISKRDNLDHQQRKHQLQCAESVTVLRHNECSVENVSD